MNQCSVNHVFLTGKKQIGKSTFLKKVLAVYPKCPAGFYTVRTNAFLETSYSGHLFSAKLPEKQRIPTEENLLFLCGNPAYDPIERFNRLGCAALLHSDAPSLMIMDELGPNEGKALDFQRAVFSALDGSVPILGVLQKTEAPFLTKIRHHPQVHVFEITEENRNDEELVRHCRKILKI